MTDQSPMAATSVQRMSRSIPIYSFFTYNWLGDRVWFRYLNIVHREDGPAEEYYYHVSNAAFHEYFLDNIFYTYDNFCNEMIMRRS